MAFIHVLTAHVHLYRSGIDADNALLSGDEITRDHYKLWLEGWYRFVAPVERLLAAIPGVAAWMDQDSRWKTPLVARDLAAMGIDAKRISICTVPAFTSEAFGLGWLYVTEQQTLAQATLLRSLQLTLPDIAAKAASYLRAYEGRATDLWIGFCAELERAVLAQTGANHQIIFAATQALQAYAKCRGRLT